MVSFCISTKYKWGIPCKLTAISSFESSYSLHLQGLSKFQAIAGITNLLIFNEYLTNLFLLVVALLAEHSFWFSGSSMVKQFQHAVQSFKSQQNISIGTVKAEVETEFNNASDGDSAWLIQWIIENKLVCIIILYFLLKPLIY